MPRYHDLIGIPFPKDHPKFKDDKKLMTLIFQIESHIEISHDLDDVMGVLSGAFKLQEDPLLSVKLGGGILGLAPSALIQSALIIYTRCFNSSGYRTKLNPSQVFSDPEQLKAHEEFHGIRDRFIAHQSSNANRHYLFVLPATHNSPMSLNPNGQTSRLIFNFAVDLGKLIDIVRATQNYVANKISQLCKTVEARLSKEQLDVINSIDIGEARGNHFEQTKNQTKNPFDQRT